MAEREVAEPGVDHTKSSWQSILPIAGVSAFLLVERSRMDALPKAALAGVCAGFTFGAAEEKMPKLGRALAGAMFAYAAWKGITSAADHSGPEFRAGLSWEEVEKATPDLSAAERAAQIGWRSLRGLPGAAPMGYNFGMWMPLPEGWEHR